MYLFYLTPYNSWSLYYFQFKKHFLNFKTSSFISITSFSHKFLAYRRQYYRSLHPLLLNKLYYLSILNSKSHLWSKISFNATKNYLLISKKNISLNLQYANYKQGITYWNGKQIYLTWTNANVFELNHCFFEHASHLFTSKNLLLLSNNSYTMLITYLFNLMNI